MFYKNNLCNVIYENITQRDHLGDHSFKHERYQRDPPRRPSRLYSFPYCSHIETPLDQFLLQQPTSGRIKNTVVSSLNKDIFIVHNNT